MASPESRPTPEEMGVSTQETQEEREVPSPEESVQEMQQRAQEAAERMKENLSSILSATKEIAGEDGLAMLNYVLNVGGERGQTSIESTLPHTLSEISKLRKAEGDNNLRGSNDLLEERIKRDMLNGRAFIFDIGEYEGVYDRPLEEVNNRREEFGVPPRPPRKKR